MNRDCSDVLLLECTEVWGDAISAHSRNSIAMMRDLGCDLICGTCDDKSRTDIKYSYLRCLKKKYKALAFSYASHYINRVQYAKFVEANPNAQLFWIVNEYNLNYPFTFLMKQGVTLDSIVLITNVEHDARAKHYKACVLLNLNLLLARAPNPITAKRYDIAYYGTFRTDRVESFKRYLHEGVVVSTSPKNIPKWRGIGCSPRFVDRFQWVDGRETLNNFKFSLYIEDEYTHQHYNFLANRFYESLFCNCVLMFDSQCVNTIKRAGIEVPECFIVSSHKELLAKTAVLSKRLDKSLAIQRSWAVNVLAERKKLLGDLAEALHAKY